MTTPLDANFDDYKKAENAALGKNLKDTHIFRRSIYPVAVSVNFPIRSNQERHRVPEDP